MGRRRATTWGAALTVVAPVLALGALTGGAADAATAPRPPSVFADWGTDLGGTPGAYVAKPTLSVSGFPDALVASDATRTSSVPRGLSTWWGSKTAPGAYWGSSQKQGFLSVRPGSDAPGTPSTTTITFAGTTDAAPAPAVAAPTGWGFVVGDVDTESVTVAGVKADGTPADAEELGFAGAFNACATRERMLSCPADAAPAPAWDPTTMTLSAADPAADTVGADAWFVPTVRLQSLTLTSTWTSGSPVFQTWLTARTHTLSGVVRTATGSTCDVTKARVLLVDPDGNQVGAARPVGQDGTWSFGRTLASDDLAARLDATGIPGCEAASQVLRPVQLALKDAQVGFTVAQTQGQDVTGSVVDDQNHPVKGARAILSVGSITRSATTGADGTFTVPAMPPNAAGEAYKVALTPPAGLVQVGTKPAEIALAGNPVDSLDFVVEGTRLSSPSADGPATNPGGTGGTGGSGGSGGSGGAGGSGGSGGSTSPVSSGVTSTSPTTSYSAAGAYTSATTSPVASSLASTGGPDRDLLPVGAALVLAGAGVVLVNRRRREVPTA